MPAEVKYPEFDVLFRLVHHVRVEFEKRLSKSKVTWSGHQVLTLIAAKQDLQEHCTRASLAIALGLTPGTTSVLVSGLVRNGLVTDPKNSKFIDGRRKQLRLTTKGRNAYHLSLVVREDVLGKALSALSDNQQRSFYRSASVMCKAAADPDHE